MTTIINTKLSERSGTKRLWIEGTKLQREGYNPGDRYDVDVERAGIVLRPKADGKYIISKRSRSGKLLPIIDICRQELASLFDGVETLRVLIASNKIVISAHHQESRVAERIDRLVHRVNNCEPLRVASLFHGGGVLDRALHEGMDQSGVKSRIGVAVEIDGDYLGASLRNNPQLWDEQSIPIESPIQEVQLGRGSYQVDVLVGGIPCTGASRSGRSKNKLRYAEEHDAAGAMFFSFLEFVKVLNPAVVIGENVAEYADTASMAVIRSVLNSLGYDVQERVMDGNDFGALEKRKRLCFVGISKGLEGNFNLDTVQAGLTKPDRVSDVLEPFDHIPDARWKTYSYLADKEERDRRAGKGFRRQLMNGSEPSCGTIGRGYSKARSTEPFVKHPSDPELCRLLTPLEHARVKGVPPSLIAELPDTRAHEILGQSVIYPKFEAVGQALGVALRIAARHESSSPVLHVAA